MRCPGNRQLHTGWNLTPTIYLICWESVWNLKEMNLKGVHWDRYEASITRRKRQQTKEPKYNFESKISYIQEHITECYLLVFRIENTVDGWDISYSKMPSLSMLADIGRISSGTETGDRSKHVLFIYYSKHLTVIRMWHWDISLNIYLLHIIS